MASLRNMSGIQAVKWSAGSRFHCMQTNDTQVEEKMYLLTLEMC